MGDDVVRLSVIGRLVRRRWRLLTVVAVLGAVLGFAASLLLSPGYEAASKVLLQGPRDEEELLTEAQIAVSLIVLDRTAEALGWDDSGTDLRRRISATVIDGNVIEVSGTASSAQRALQLTDRATQEYTKFSAQIVSDAANVEAQVAQERRALVLERIDGLRERINEIQPAGAPAPDSVAGRAEFDQLRSGLTSATGELDDIDGRELETEGEATLSRAAIAVLEPAVVRGAASPTPVELVVGGAVVAFLLTVFGLLAAARRDARLRDPDRIAAALGAPLLGGVAVAVGPHRPPAAPVSDGTSRVRGWANRIGDLLGEDAAWDPTPGAGRQAGTDDDIRYRRILARLRATPQTNLRLLVVLCDDDAVARRAVARLASAADRGPVSLVTDNAELAELARNAGGAVTVRSAARPSPGAQPTVLRVAEISPARPTLQESGSIAGALVVVSAGTRTAWELVGVAEGCADAGHRVLGVLVVSPRPADAVPDPGTGAEPDDISGSADPATNGSMMAGTS